MNWGILTKYLNGLCSEAELKQLQDWLRENPANEDFFQSFVEASEYESEMDSDDIQQAWENLKKNHMNEARGAIPGLYRSDYMPEKSWWAAYGQKWLVVGSAAAVILLLTVIGMFQLKRSGFFVSSKAPKKIACRTVTTQKGQNIELHLKDGTVITLNAASKLRIPENYGLGKRVVYLKGEAFFKVIHNEKMPFTVHSGSLRVRDVGTEFNVWAYDSTQVSVAVKEGAVSIRKAAKNEDEPVRLLGKLTKNKVGRIYADGNFTISAIHDMGLFTGWMHDKFVFHDTPLSDVVPRLERQFNVKIKVVGAVLKKRTLTATYENLSLKQILNVMSVSLRMKIKRTDTSIIFKPTN